MLRDAFELNEDKGSYDIHPYRLKKSKILWVHLAPEWVDDSPLSLGRVALVLHQVPLKDTITDLLSDPSRKTHDSNRYRSTGFHVA